MAAHAHSVGPSGGISGSVCEYLRAARWRRFGAISTGNPMKPAEYNFPTVHDGLRGMQFIYKAVESADKGAVWVKV